MEPGGPRTPRRIREEAASRRRRISLVAGAIGLAALFGGGIATLVAPGAIVPLTAVIVSGVVLLVVAFFLARTTAVHGPLLLEK